MQKITVRFDGVAPLLMNRYTMQCDQVKKSRAEKKVNERDSGEWTQKVYWSDALKCVALPAVIIEATIANAARAFKLGKQATATIFVDGDEVPVLSNGKRITELALNGQLELDGRGAVIQRSRVDRFRPMVRAWSMEVPFVLLDEAAIDRVMFEKIVERAGRFVGLCDFRPRFGRFETRIQ